MSDRELLRKFYFGLYKINCKGHFACPLYDEKTSENNQMCDFSVENQGDELSDEEFRFFWSHVQSLHQETYEDILKICISKASKIANENQHMKVYDFIGSTFVNLNKLAASWTNKSMDDNDFLAQFRSELELLEKKVNDIVVSSVSSNNVTTSAASLTKL